MTLIFVCMGQLPNYNKGILESQTQSNEWTNRRVEAPIPHMMGGSRVANGVHSAGKCLPEGT